MPRSHFVAFAIWMGIKTGCHDFAKHAMSVLE
jgi:hypothetical protein